MGTSPVTVEPPQGAVHHAVVDKNGLVHAGGTHQLLRRQDEQVGDGAAGREGPSLGANLSPPKTKVSPDRSAGTS